jgi:hypothetical protein
VEPDGASWRWGLELKGLAGKAVVTSDANRITYRWNQNLDEWFVNGTGGLDHGFTLRKPQEIRLTVRGGLRPRMTEDGVEFVEADSTPRIRYTALKAWDADRKALPARITVQSGEVVLALDDRGARYPVTIDPTVQQAYLKASNTGAGDRFGVSVAISGNTVVVGASQEASAATGVDGNQADNSVPNRGAAYVFVRNGSTWAQQAYLKQSDSEAGAVFGTSVAIDGNTIVVGANSQDGGGPANSGAVYVFTRSGSTWTQQGGFLKASAPGGSDSFGFTVAISGDTLVAGAEYQGTSGANSGAAYVFLRAAGVWSQQAFLNASNPGVNDQFGHSVAISANTVVVGSIFEDSGLTGVVAGAPNDTTTGNAALNTGAAYVFTRSGVTWTQQAYLKPSGAAPDTEFGTSVAVSGGTILVGAPADDTTLANSGAAYLFERTGTTWTSHSTFRPSPLVAQSFFGSFVALSGDTAIIGARAESTTAASSGAAYVFFRTYPLGASTWTQQPLIKASNPGTNDQFGFAVGASGNSVVIGAEREDSSTAGINSSPNDAATDAGAAYSYAAAATANTTYAAQPSGALVSAAGSPITVGNVPLSIAVADFDRDGIADLVVANAGDNNVRIMKGNGSGGFTQLGSPIAAGGPVTSSVSVGDLNGDGYVDIVAANDAGSNLGLLIGNGSGGFTLSGTLFAQNAKEVVMADLNGDGFKDLAAASGSGNIYVYIGDGLGSFAAASGSPFATVSSTQSLAVGDVNGDGVLDLVAANGNSASVSVLLGTGAGSFASAVSYSVGAFPRSVRLADFNGDGNLDAVTANQNSNTVSLLLGSGSGTFAAAANFTVGTNPVQAQVGDLNGDGNLDLAVANSGGGVNVLLGNGSGSFTPA